MNPSQKMNATGNVIAFCGAVTDPQWRILGFIVAAAAAVPAFPLRGASL
jgi:hypothetical protein